MVKCDKCIVRLEKPETWCEQLYSEGGYCSHGVRDKTPQEILVEIAMAEVGTLETWNNGNKYAEWFDAEHPNFYHVYPCNHYAWCGIFANWCYAQAFGFEDMIKLNCTPVSGGRSCGCYEAYSYYDKAGRMRHGKDPQVGDQVFFGTGGRHGTHHTGIIVERIDSMNYWTVEGNAGILCDRVAHVKRTYAEACGWGRPDWTIVGGE